MDSISESIELVRVIFLIGAVLALATKKMYGVTPGGIIVPGILAGIIFTSINAFLITVASTLLCWAIYKLFLSSFAVSARGMTLILISLSVAIGLVALVIQDKLDLLYTETVLLSMIVPGLITLSSKKYGIARVAYSTLSVTAITMLVGMAIALSVPYGYLSYLSVYLGEFPSLSLPNPFVVLPISMITAVALYFRFGIRSGGYMIAPFLAALLYLSPVEFLILSIGIALSVAIVKLIQRATLIIGLERFVVSLFCGYFVVSIMDSMAIAGLIQNYYTSPLILITSVAVITNDLCLQPIRSTLAKGISPSLMSALLTRIAV
jgi:hypothetical protein